MKNNKKLTNAHIYFARWFNPDLFENFDQQAIHQKYIDEFCDINFDVSEHDIFAIGVDIFRE